MRWRRRRSPKPRGPDIDALLRKRAAEEDAICAQYGPDCEQVVYFWDPRFGPAHHVTWRGGLQDVVYLRDGGKGW